MYYILYKTTNKLNNKFYIGIHKCKTLEFDGYYGSGILLSKSIKLHGKSNFSRETLYTFDSWNEAKIKEKEIVSVEFCLRDDTYNISVGGTGGNTLAGASLNKKLEIKEKRKETNILNGNFIYDGDKLEKAKIRMLDVRIQPNNKGRKHTENSKLNMGKSNINCVWITNGVDSMFNPRDSELPDGWYFGRSNNYKKFQSHTENTKNKISEKLTGIVCYNNGIVNLKLKNNEIPPNGYVLGMIQKHKKSKWITNGILNNKIQINDEVPNGWYLGRTINWNLNRGKNE